MTDGWRSVVATLTAISATGLALGVAMGIAWWLLTPPEAWVRIDGGLGAESLSSSGWFASDGWFLLLGAAAGLCLTAVTWVWVRRRPITGVIGLVAAAALVALVAWSVGGMLGPPDLASISDALAIGATADGPLGLRAMGVLGAPMVTGLALVALLLALAPVTDDSTWGRSDLAPALG